MSSSEATRLRRVGAGISEAHEKIKTEFAKARSIAPTRNAPGLRPEGVDAELLIECDSALGLAGRAPLMEKAEPILRAIQKAGVIAQPHRRRYTNGYWNIGEAPVVEDLNQLLKDCETSLFGNRKP
jgi:hypothetical protein